MALSALNRFTPVDFNLLKTPLKSPLHGSGYGFENTFLNACKARFEYFDYRAKCQEFNQRITHIHLKREKWSKSLWAINSLRFLGVVILTVGIGGIVLGSLLTKQICIKIARFAKTVKNFTFTSPNERAKNLISFYLIFILFVIPASLIVPIAPLLGTVASSFGLYLIFRPRQFLLRFVKNCKKEKRQLQDYQQKMKNCLEDNRQKSSLTGLLNQCKEYQTSLKHFFAIDNEEKKALKNELKNIENNLSVLIEIKTAP